MNGFQGKVFEGFLGLRAYYEVVQEAPSDRSLAVES
jgi:hypothetical protein